MINKIALLIALIACSTLAALAQIEHPVKWSYGTKRLPAPKNEGPGMRLYEIHLRATIQNGWHVYAQVQPDNSVSKPTSIKFKTDNDLTLVGKVKELGKMIKWIDPSSGLGANEYSGTVDFVQVVKINGALDNLSGVITFQTCTDHMCLSPEDVNFTVPIK